MHVRLELNNKKTNLHQTWHAYSLRTGRDFKKVKTPKNSWVQVPVRLFPVAQKLSTIEERHKEQSCLFRRGDYRNKGHNPDKLSWVPFLTKMFCCSETKHDIRTAPRPVVSVKRLQEQCPQPWKSALASSPGEDDLCSSENKKHRRRAQRTKLFVSVRILQKLRSQTRKLPWVRILVKMLDLAIIFICYSTIHIEWSDLW
jgi:hypothetical protein